MYDNLSVDIAFECVGGEGAVNAINDAIEHLKPCGILVLMGVSEHGQLINTRRILEKGITVLGCSRSRKTDFEKAIQIIQNLPYKAALKKVITNKIKVKNQDDLEDSFEQHIKTKNKEIIIFNL